MCHHDNSLLLSDGPRLLIIYFLWAFEVGYINIELIKNRLIVIFSLVFSYLLSLLI